MNILQCGTINRATRAAQRRDHILEISRHLFIEKGFHGTGVAQIASTSGVKVGQIYRDFSCKEDIIAALALRDFSQLLDEATLENAIRTGDKAAVRRSPRRAWGAAQSGIRMGSVCPPKLPLTPLGGRMSDLPSLSAVDVGNSTPPSAKPPAPTPTPRRSPQVDYRSALPACGHHPHPRGPSRPGSHQINHAKPRRRPRRRPLFFPTTGIPGACADSPTPHRSPSSVPQSPSCCGS